MLWRRSAPPLTVPAVAPVPDAEALRRALLQASWQRGRWVARRRVALRWLLWACTRYLMPATLVFGLTTWLWLGVLPSASGPWHPIRQWASKSFPVEQHTPAPPATPAAAEALPPPLATAVKPAEAPADELADVDYTPEGEEIPRPLALKFEARWAAADQRPVGAAAPASDGEPDPQPTLKPENWLHSKEP